MFSNEDYLAQLLVEAGLVTEEDVDSARGSLTGSETVIEHLLNSGALGQEDLASTLALNAGIDFVSLRESEIDPALVEQIPTDIAERFMCVPMKDDGLTLKVAIPDPLNFETLDSLPTILNRELDFACATLKDIQEHLSELYEVEGTTARREEGVFVTSGEEEDINERDDAPIIRLVMHTLTEAMRMKASDIHIEPLETSVRIRYRLDGKLVHTDSHPKKLLPSIIARLKVMSGTMSIAEKRLPQDGRIQLKMGDKDVDLRVSSVPSNHGESIVMRILDKTALLLGLPELGFFSDDQQTFERLLGLPDGILLVTGPTGSGKTTTL